MLKEKKMKLKILVVLILSFVFLMSVNLLGFHRAVKNSFYSISLPIQEKIDQGAQKVSGFWNYLVHLKKIQKKNKQLIKERNEILSQNAQLREYGEQNQELKKALDLELQKEFSLVLARLVVRDIPQGTALINKGSGSLSSGMPLISEGRVLLGKVRRTYSNFSRVELVSSPHTSFPAKILDKEITGVIKGKGGGEIYLDTIPQDKEVTPGDTVITDVSSIFPSELLIGKVAKVEKSDIEPFQQAKIEPLAKVEDLEYVLVISNFREFKEAP